MSQRLQQNIVMKTGKKIKNIFHQLLAEKKKGEKRVGGGKS